MLRRRFTDLFTYDEGTVENKAPQKTALNDLLCDEIRLRRTNRVLTYICIFTLPLLIVSRILYFAELYKEESMHLFDLLALLASFILMMILVKLEKERDLCLCQIKKEHCAIDTKTETTADSLANTISSFQRLLSRDQSISSQGPAEAVEIEVKQESPKVPENDSSGLETPLYLNESTPCGSEPGWLTQEETNLSSSDDWNNAGELSEESFNTI